MTLKSFREKQRAERAQYVEDLLAQAGSVRQAAKLADVRRTNFIRLRNALSLPRDILTAPAPKPTP